MLAWSLLRNGDCAVMLWSQETREVGRSEENGCPGGLVQCWKTTQDYEGREEHRAMATWGGGMKQEGGREQ